MRLFELLQDLISSDSDITDVSEEEEKIVRQMGTDRSALREAIDQFTPQTVEQVFAEMPHEPRVNYVKQRGLSRKKWREMAHYIRNEDEMREKWGLDGVYVVSGESGGIICRIHEAIVEPRTLSDSQQNASARSRSHSTQKSGGVSANVGVATGSVNGSETTTDQATNTQSTTTGDTKTIQECGTGDKDCKLNRRAFIKAGDYHMTGGKTQTEKLEEYFERAAAEAGVDYPRNSGEEDSEASGPRR